MLLIGGDCSSRERSRESATENEPLARPEELVAPRARHGRLKRSGKNVVFRAVIPHPVQEDQIAALSSLKQRGDVIADLGDVRGRAHLEQPLADRQVALLDAHEHRSAAEAVSFADVRGRPSDLVEPFRNEQMPVGARQNHWGEPYFWRAKRTLLEGAKRGWDIYAGGTYNIRY